MHRRLNKNESLWGKQATGDQMEANSFERQFETEGRTEMSRWYKRKINGKSIRLPVFRIANWGKLLCQREYRQCGKEKIN